MSRRSCGVLPIVAYVVGPAERINWTQQPAREALEAEATRLRDEPGLGRGGARPIHPRPYRGVSGEADKRGGERSVNLRPRRGGSGETERSVH